MVNLDTFLIVSTNLLPAKQMERLLEQEFSAAVHRIENMPPHPFFTVPLKNPCLFLIDCLEADIDAIYTILESLPTPVPPHIRIALFNVTENNLLVPMIKCYQIKGLFYEDDCQAAIIKGIRMILDGHLWLSRRILTACIRTANHSASIITMRSRALLSDRELEILEHLTFGESNQEIADAMLISLNTVKNHLYNIYKKIDVPNRLHASHWATHLLNV